MDYNADAVQAHDYPAVIINKNMLIFDPRSNALRRLDVPPFIKITSKCLMFIVFLCIYARASALRCLR